MYSTTFRLILKTIAPGKFLSGIWKYWRSHPENYLFSLSKHMFTGSEYPIYFSKKCTEKCWSAGYCKQASKTRSRTTLPSRTCFCPTPTSRPRGQFGMLLCQLTAWTSLRPVVVDSPFTAAERRGGACLGMFAKSDRFA